MSDLKKRLRGQRLDSRSPVDCMVDAADEIERLERREGELCDLLEDIRDAFDLTDWWRARIDAAIAGGKEVGDG